MDTKAPEVIIPQVPPGLPAGAKMPKPVSNPKYTAPKGYPMASPPPAGQEWRLPGDPLSKQQTTVPAGATTVRQPTLKPPAPSMDAPATAPLSPEQTQIVQIALSDPAILSAIADGVSATAQPEKMMFGG